MLNWVVGILQLVNANQSISLLYPDTTDQSLYRPFTQTLCFMKMFTTGNRKYLSSRE